MAESLGARACTCVILLKARSQSLPLFPVLSLTTLLPVLSLRSIVGQTLRCRPRSIAGTPCATQATEMRIAFLARQRGAFEARQLLRHVINGRKACEALDRKLGLHTPHLWPEVEPENPLLVCLTCVRA